MTRLNNKIREAIIKNAIVKSGVTAREEALITRRAKLADDVRLFAIGGAEKEAEILATYDKIKKYIDKNSHNMINVDIGLANSNYEIDINFAGRSSTLYFHGHVQWRGEHGNVKHVRRDFVASKRVVIAADNPLNDEFDAIELEQRTVNDLRAHVKAEVTAMVNSVTTVKKLLETWPESKELLPPEEQVQSTAIVANVDNLNTIIGLPSED